MAQNEAEYYRGVLDNLTGGFLSVSLDGKVVYVNPTAGRILHLPEVAAHKGKCYTTMLSAFPALLAVIRDALATHKTVHRAEVSVLHGDATLIIGYSTLQVRNHKGDYLGIGIIFQDLSVGAKKAGDGRPSAEKLPAASSRADESLATERERLAITLTCVGEGIVSTDMRGRIQMMNLAAEEMTGRRQADLLDRPIDELLRFVHEKDRGSLSRLVRDVLHRGRASSDSGDLQVLRVDGTQGVVVPEAALIRDRGGELIGVALSLRDVTQQRRATEEVFKARNLESVGFLAGGIAHDFNNLLTGIQGNIGLLKDSLPAAGPLRLMADDTESICRKATALARQLLTFARGGEPFSEPLDISELVADIPRLILGGSNVRSHAMVPPGLWPVEADRTQIEQAIGNLVVNAREAMPEGGTVRLRAENVELTEPLLHLPPGRYVRLTVSDDGPGIPAEVRPHVFDPYYSTKGRGSGLGLYIVFSIIRRHGGHISLESAEGRGAVFSILLAATEKPLPGGRDAAADTASVVAGEGSILLMDDEEVVQRIASKILVRAGYSVRLTPSGEEAVAAYRAALAAGKRYDAVVLDMTVPGGMGGREAGERILALDSGARVILTSGYNDDATKGLAIKSGRFAFLEKPYTVRELTDAVSLESRKGP